MRRRTPSVAAFVIVLSALTFGQAPTPLRIATWNIQGLGNSGSNEWLRAIDVIGRMNADVVAIQEITSTTEVNAFPSFAAANGYPFHAVSTISGTLSGNLYTGVLSRYPIVFSDSSSAAELSGDPTANDISRDVFQAHIQVPGAATIVGVFTVHLKSASTNTDFFRRAVEAIRVRQAISAFVSANPQAPYFLVGDFNEDIGDGPFNQVYNTTPTGLPMTFDLGNDITFPLPYAPFTGFTSTGLLIANATQEDSTSLDATRSSSGRRLDYILYAGGAALVGDEVYNSSRDNGIDDLPLGNWLAKTGSPLPSTTSNDASDHFNVFADVTVPSAQTTLFPGSQEDLVLSTGIDGTPTSGPMQDYKVAPAGSLLYVNYASPGGTFDFVPPLLIAQLFVHGSPPIGPLPGLWVNTLGGVILVNGLDPGPIGLSEVIVPVTGNTRVWQVPIGLSGMSAMFQVLAVTPFAANGFFAISDAHEIAFTP